MTNKEWLECLQWEEHKKRARQQRSNTVSKRSAKSVCNGTGQVLANSTIKGGVPLERVFVQH